MQLAALGRHDERALLPLDRNEVDIRVLLRHADGEAPLAAADLQMQRLVIAEQRAPLAALFLRLERHHIRARRKAHVQIFLFAHSHALKFPFFRFFSVFIIQGRTWICKGI